MGLVPVIQSLEGDKYQVSWTTDVKKVSTGDHSVDLYDSEGFTALKRSRDRGEAATVSPLVTIVVSYPGSYGGPWLNSEHLAAGLAALVLDFVENEAVTPPVDWELEIFNDRSIKPCRSIIIMISILINAAVKFKEKVMRAQYGSNINFIYALFLTKYLSIDCLFN